MTRKPHNENHILISLLLLLFLVVVACAFTSCKSKKKITEREKTEEVVTTVEKGNTLTANDVVKETVFVNTLEELFFSKNDKIELTQADSKKTIVLTDHRGQITTITGANAIISNEEKKETREANGLASVTEVDKTVNTKNVQKKEASKKATSSRTSDSEVSGISPIIGLGVGIAIVIILVLLYRKHNSLV